MDAGSLYDSLPEDKKDMPRHLFIKKIRDLTDQGKMQHDLSRILQGRHEKGKIDAALRRGK